MKILLLILNFCLISDGGDSKEVTGYSGGGVLIKCKYDTKYTKKKYFCKDSWPKLRCSDLIKTGDKNMWVTSGRFSLFDDTKSAEFRVMIREITVEDTGTYQCGVDKMFMDIYTPVELKVKEDLSHDKSISKTVHVGGDLNISFKYPQSLRNHPKFLCMGLQPTACVYKESVTESRKDVNFGKFSLYDDRTEQIFTVSIRNVAKTDSGEFWCGAEAAWTSDHGYKVYFTQIRLTVTDSSVPALTSKQPSTLSSSSKTSSSTSTLPSPPSSSSSSPTTPSSSSSSPTTPSSASSSAGFSASTVITVFVILLLFLIGISVLTMILRKRHQIKATSTARGSVQNAGNNNGVPLDDCNYEKIKNIMQCPALDTSTVYSTAHLPTNPSDPSLVYANHDLPSIPCDSGVYSNAQLPKKPEQDIYSTVQLPTSCEAEKSTQGPIYATVSFHTKSTRSNDAVAKIRFNKVGVSCDYDMVSNLPSSA